jgi:undecaprenyl diphosphate synthase
MSASQFPRHIGIIMDGNGRWARSRRQARTQGHLEGLKAAKEIVKAASDLGVAYLTLYVFSTENWKRTAEEVGFIMGLVKRYLMAELDFFRRYHIKIRHAGDAASLPPDIREEIERVRDDTRDFTGLQVILALNYGGRDAIIRGIRRCLQEGLSPEDLNEETFRRCLDNPDVPDPDLIIRTAGEFRTSNFLLWEGAYAEYCISGKYWPDYTREDLAAAIGDFQNRDRKYGGVVREAPGGDGA